MANNRPNDTIRGGLLKATIWKCTSENGVFCSVELSRRYRGDAGTWHGTSSFLPGLHDNCIVHRRASCGLEGWIGVPPGPLSSSKSLVSISELDLDDESSAASDGAVAISRIESPLERVRRVQVPRARSRGERLIRGIAATRCDALSRAPGICFCVRVIKATV